ncbi:MAG: division/cell wall cluster transcriptional repressor MraZ [Bacteroidetes bacterium]|nr:division/cell wall cluster transcriptional repressor MraZ [Bacteroidota bacterium]
MTNLIGEYECRLDPKGRVMLPTGLLRQIPKEAYDRFVIHRGFEKCLVLYPINVWNEIVGDIEKNYDHFASNHRQFLRYFYRGANEVALDTANRVLIPKSLLEYAGVDKDLVMFAVFNHIEIWAQDTYNQLLSDEPEDFARLAEEVMGKKHQQTNNVS